MDFVVGVVSRGDAAGADDVVAVFVHSAIEFGDADVDEGFDGFAGDGTGHGLIDGFGGCEGDAFAGGEVEGETGDKGCVVYGFEHVFDGGDAA